MGGISVRYAFDNGWAIFGSAAYTENLPIIDDIANPAFIIQSEKGRSYELGTSFAREDVFGAGDNLALKLNYYTNDIWDITTYSGISSVNREGFELEAAYGMANGFYVDANAHLSSGTSVSTAGVAGDFAQNPQDTLRLTLGKKFGEELDLSWEIVAAKRYDEGGTVSPGFGVHNLRATYVPQQGVLEGTQIRFGIENAFDKSYRPKLSSLNSTGRNFKVSLSKTF
jgi:hemoglobin/transferrin/lactoferrin receptor protein